MTYIGDEVSVRGGKPNELYRFAGTYSTYRYTSGPKRVEFQAPDEDEAYWYEPIAIQRGAINSGTQDDDKLDLTITLAVTHQVVLDYGFQATPPRLELTIWRYHTIEEFVPFWTGPVDNIQTTKGRATIRSYSKLSAALSQALPNVFYQAPCNHTLYDPRCGVSYAAWSAELEVLAINGRVLTLSNVLDENEALDGAMLGGEVALVSGERRMITNQVQATIPAEDEEDPDVPVTLVTVNFPFTNLQVGALVTAAAGCDLAYRGDCKLKFANQLSFGGFPFIPPENPFLDGVEPGTVLDDGTCLPNIEVSTTFAFELEFNGCNTGYCPTRNWYMPELDNGDPTRPYVVNPPLAPGGPSGKAIPNGVSLINNCNASGEVYEHNYFNDPESEWYQNPLAAKLRGQRIFYWSTTNGDFTIKIEGATATGSGQLQIQYGAFWCGSNVATGTLLRTDCTGFDGGCSTATLIDHYGMVGNTPYNWYW